MSEVHRSGVQCGFQFEGEGFIVPLSKVLVELSLLACHQTPAMINRSNGHYKKKGRKPVRNPPVWVAACFFCPTPLLTPWQEMVAMETSARAQSHRMGQLKPEAVATQPATRISLFRRRGHISSYCM